MLFRIKMIAALLALTVMSCEYGPEHGQANNQPNTISNNQTDSKDVKPEKPHQAKDTGADNPGEPTPHSRAEPVAPKPKDFTEKNLRFEGKQIILTHHARCRMDCRHIDAYEIQEVIDQGHINAKKSSRTAPAGKCPTTAYEGTTRDNQFVRVILGTCETPKIITVIDLKNDYNCTCK